MTQNLASPARPRFSFGRRRFLVAGAAGPASRNQPDFGPAATSGHCCGFARGELLSEAVLRELDVVLSGLAQRGYAQPDPEATASDEAE